MPNQEFTKIIPIANRFIQGKPTDTASARALHQKLKVGREFASWMIGRVKQYGFIENEDYVKVYTQSGVNSKGGRKQVNYFVTLDMAKELAMIEKTEEGRKMRRYFIECEKQLRAKRGQLLPSEKTDQKQLPVPLEEPKPITTIITTVPGQPPKYATHEGPVIIVPAEAYKKFHDDSVSDYLGLINRTATLGKKCIAASDPKTAEMVAKI